MAAARAILVLLYPSWNVIFSWAFLNGILASTNVLAFICKWAFLYLKIVFSITATTLCESHSVCLIFYNFFNICGRLSCITFYDDLLYLDRWLYIAAQTKSNGIISHELGGQATSSFLEMIQFSKLIFSKAMVLLVTVSLTVALSVDDYNRFELHFLRKNSSKTPSHKTMSPFEYNGVCSLFCSYSTFQVKFCLFTNLFNQKWVSSENMFFSDIIFLKLVHSPFYMVIRMEFMHQLSITLSHVPHLSL